MRAAFFMSTVDTLQHIWWHEPGPDDDGALCLLDQRLLPAQEVVVRCTSVAQVAHAITSRQVRGAPAIGCSAAYGMLIACAT